MLASVGRNFFFFRIIVKNRFVFMLLYGRMRFFLFRISLPGRQEALCILLYVDAQFLVCFFFFFLLAAPPDDFIAMRYRVLLYPGLAFASSFS